MIGWYTYSVVHWSVIVICNQWKNFMMRLYYLHFISYQEKTWIIHKRIQLEFGYFIITLNRISTTVHTLFYLYTLELVRDEIWINKRCIQTIMLFYALFCVFETVISISQNSTLKTTHYYLFPRQRSPVFHRRFLWKAKKQTLVSNWKINEIASKAHKT